MKTEKARPGQNLTRRLRKPYTVYAPSYTETFCVGVAIVAYIVAVVYRHSTVREASSVCP